MHTDTFTSDASYVAYMSRVNGMMGDLPKTGQLEIRREISSHIYESLRAFPDLSVDEALRRFGEPEAYLPEWVVLKKMEVATGSFNPVRIFKALWFGIIHHSVHAFKYVLFGVLYLLTFIFGALCILKVIFPGRTGLLIYPHDYVFGFNAGNIEGAHEVLGWWFIPISLFLTLLFYTIITTLLKVSLSKNK